MEKQNWKLDPMHSEIHFKVKHLVISTVTGSFNSFESNLTHENEDWTDSEIDFTADISSIDTGNEHRDNHLKSPEFFHQEEHPTLEFKSTSFEKISGNQYHLHGNLTIKGITKPTTLTVEFGGIALDGYNNTRAGFEFSGQVNRKDFGLTYNGLTEAGGAILSDEVKILGSIQFIKQA